jgi:hypothetical protein
MVTRNGTNVQKMVKEECDEKAARDVKPKMLKPKAVVKRRRLWAEGGRGVVEKKERARKVAGGALYTGRRALAGPYRSGDSTSSSPGGLTWFIQTLERR